nr:hypothetical protein [Ruegeria atlantica]
MAYTRDDMSRRPNSVFTVIFFRVRKPEVGEDPVAQQFGHMATMIDYRLGNCVMILLHEATEIFRVELGRQFGRPH